MSSIGVCHPDWRGVRTSAYTFRTPVIESDDCARDAGEILSFARNHSASTVVIHGVPAGSHELLSQAAGAGLATGVVLYSSPAQHGAGKSESDVIDNLLEWQRTPVLGRLGLAKEGVAESLRALGHEAWFVPARAPSMPPVTPARLEGEPSVGVFAEPFWRKNVVTQLAAVAQIEGATAHVMRRPDVGYLDGLAVVEHGELGWEEFLAALAGVDINLYVTLSECLPLTPMESYLAGTPCLASRTSAVFRSDDELWELTTVDELDNPRAIASAATRLAANRVEAMERADSWLTEWDAYAAGLWAEFTG